SYPPGTGGSNPPLPWAMRNCRSKLLQYLPAGARMFQSEMGIGYPQTYAKNYPTLLDMQKHAAWFIRGHLIELGEGDDNAFLFYTADYPGENGFGMSFNLALTSEPWGSSKISPKPDAMAAAVMTRLLEGTFTLGYLNDMPFDGVSASALGYAFQSRSSNQV